MIKVGIIGCGNVANAHISAIHLSNQAVLHGVYDVSSERSKKVSQENNCKLFNNLEEILSLSDAIIIATPNHFHSYYALQAIKFAKHILCEKPMATTVNEAEKMHLLSSCINKSTVIGFNYRFMPFVQYIKNIYDTKKLGECINIRFECRKNSAIARQHFTWRDGADSNRTSGALGDLGIHFIDLLHFISSSEVDMASVKSKIVTNITQKQGLKVMVDDYAEIYGLLRNGCHYSFLVSKSSPEEETGMEIKAVFKDAEIFYDSRQPKNIQIRKKIQWEAIPLTIDSLLPDPPKEFCGWADTFHYQLEAWLCNIKNRLSDQNLATFEDGYKSQKTLDEFMINSTC